MSGESAKQTGGGGFNFEDKVAATFLLYLLAGSHPFSSEIGQLLRIDFQAKGGWLFDDLILTTQTDSGESRICCSIKSYKVVKETGVDADLVGRCWKEFLGKSGSPFNLTSDYLAFVGFRAGEKPTQAFSDLLVEAKRKSSDSLGAHLSNQTKRELFKSWQCPSAIDDGKAHEDKVGNLLRRVIYRPYDFEDSSSLSAERTLELCSLVLSDSTGDRPKEFFSQLCHIASQYRGTGGTLDYQELIAKIGPTFSLKAAINVAPDLKRIHARTKLRMGTIRTSIADKISLQREKLLEDISSFVVETPILIFNGRSGSGKSALAKRFIDSSAEPCVWLEAGTDTVLDLREHLGLHFSLVELFERIPSDHFYIVLDSVERLQNASEVAVVRAFLTELSESRIKSKIRILVTSEEEQLERTLSTFGSELLKFGNYKVVPVPPLDVDEMLSVIEHFPALRLLLLNSELKDLVRLPKVLDLIGRKHLRGGAVPAKTFTQETQLVDWLWAGLIATGPNALGRDIFVQQLAEKQANELRSRIPLSELNPAHANLATELITNRICSSENSQLEFDHDLVGYWARYVLIKSKDNLTNYLKGKSLSPFWHQAVRLYGQHLLESNSTIDAWLDAYIAFTSSDNELLSFSEDLLDSLFFCTNSAQVLERALPHLLKDGGKNLEKLLVRFLRKGTEADPSMQALITASGETDLLSHVQAYFRIPKWTLWRGMLRFLSSAFDKIRDISPANLGSICLLWLEKTDTDFPLRRHVAEMALALAIKCHEERRQLDYWKKPSDELAAIVYRAGLLCANELPEQTAVFALDAAGRAVSDEEIKKKREEETRISISRYSIPRSYRFVDPWPIGPKRDVDDVFRKVCVESPALQALIVAKPEVAKEVVQAVVIKGPGNRSDDYHRLDDKLEFEDDQYWYPPMYFKGPFLNFLNSNPRNGIETIVGLINFATEQAVRNDDDESEPSSIEIVSPDGSEVKKLLGNWNIYFWNRQPTHVPNVVTSALMALEFWLVKRLRNKEDISDDVKLIYALSNSMAIAGMLLSIVKIEAALLDGPVGRLVQVQFLHDWEMQYAVHPHVDLQLMGWRLPHINQMQYKLAEQWHRDAYRSRDVSDIWLQKYITFPDSVFSGEVEAAKSFWGKRLSELADGYESQLLEKLCATYNRNNWINVKLEDGRTGQMYRPPPELVEKNQASLALSQQMLWLQMIPHNCRELMANRKTLTEGECDQFAAQFEKIDDLVATQKLDPEAPDFLGPKCGIAAILLSSHWSWLKAQPELFTKFKQQIVGGAKFAAEDPEDLARIIWSTSEFVTLGLVSLYKEDPEDRELRGLLADIVLGGGSGLLKIVYDTLYRYRDRLKADFDLLVSMGVRRAIKEDQFRADLYRNYRRENSEAEIQQKRKEWVEQERTSFIKKTFIADRPHLRSLVSTDEGNEGESSRVHKGDLNAHWGILRAVFCHYGPDQSNDTLSPDEKFQFFDEALDAICALLEPARTHTRPIEGTPDDFERWILRGAANFVALQCDAKYDVLWKKIIDLGPYPHYWLDSFFSELIISGIYSERLPSFVDLWRRVLKNAHANPEWSLQSDSKFTPEYRGLDNGWLALMGWDSYLLKLWTAEMQDVVSTLIPEIRLWATKHLSMDDCLINYIRFLDKDGAKNFRIEALNHLKTEWDSRGSSFWSVRSGKVCDEMAQLLSKCHSENWDRLRGDEKAFHTFSAMLAALIERHHPVAMHLSDTIASKL